MYIPAFKVHTQEDILNFTMPEKYNSLANLIGFKQQYCTAVTKESNMKYNVAMIG